MLEHGRACGRKDKIVYSYRRSYRGPLRALILDWAGTTVDFGSFAPVAAVVDAFERQGIAVTSREARLPMGMAKRDHLSAVAEIDSVREQWINRYGHALADTELDELYASFMAIETDRVAHYATLIGGTLATVDACRDRNIQIGSCTGYSRGLMEAILPIAREQGYAPDSLVCPDDVPRGRPHPWMAIQNAINLLVYPLDACVKVGDTVVDILEGLNAGMWSVGLARTGNELGLTEAEVDALAPAELAARLDRIRERMYQSGAHYVVDGIADLPPVIDMIEERLRAGERP